MFHSLYECIGYEYEENTEYIIFLDNVGGSYELCECKVLLEGIEQNNNEYPVFNFHGKLYDATLMGAESKYVTKDEFVSLVSEYVKNATGEAI